MLELKNVSYAVQEDGQSVTILDDVSFTVPDGSFCVITGPNGGGKSTAARLIMGIYRPTSGKILYNGTDITDMSVTDRANLGISFALQQPVTFKGLDVLDLLRLAAKKKLTTAEACEYLSAVGLCAKDYIGREVNRSLSGGELKRIEIATVLARGTAMSVFDEPEAGIDIWSFQNLIKVFESMRKKTRGSILVISHQERILNIADEIILIANGKLVRQGKREEMFKEIMKGNAAQASCYKIQEADADA